MVLENFLIDVDVLWDRAGKELYEKPQARSGRKMRVRVTNKGLVEDLTGYTLNLGWKSTIDETKFGLDAFTAVDITKGIFEIAYTSGMLTNIGTLVGTLQLVPSVGDATESNNFMITVKKSAVDAEAMQSETSFTALVNALVSVNDWNARIDAVEADFIQRANDMEATYPQEIISLGQQLADTATQLKNQSFIFEAKTGIVAHRGAHVDAPENTLKAIRKAGEYGYELVELDLQETSDGAYIILHDNTVDRTTNGTGTVANMTLAQIKALLVDENFVGKDAEEVIRIPTFDEACKECQKWGLGINVDTSKMTFDEVTINYVVGLLKKHNLFAKSFFVVGDKPTRLLLTSLYPDANITWLTAATDPANNIAECALYKNAFVTYSDVILTDALITAYRDANIPVFVYECENFDDVYKYASKGIRFVETNTILPKGVY